MAASSGRRVQSESCQVIRPLWQCISLPHDRATTEDLEIGYEIREPIHASRMAHSFYFPHQSRDQNGRNRQAAKMANKGTLCNSFATHPVYILTIIRHHQPILQWPCEGTENVALPQNSLECITWGGDGKTVDLKL